MYKPGSPTPGAPQRRDAAPGFRQILWGLRPPPRPRQSCAELQHWLPRCTFSLDHRGQGERSPKGFPFSQGPVKLRPFPINGDATISCIKSLQCVSFPFAFTNFILVMLQKPSFLSWNTSGAELCPKKLCNKNIFNRSNTTIIPIFCSLSKKLTSF